MEAVTTVVRPDSASLSILTEYQSDRSEDPVYFFPVSCLGDWGYGDFTDFGV